MGNANSGNKPKRVKYAAIYKATEKALHAILPKVPEAIEDLVLGVQCVEQTKEGQRVYWRPPNIEAIKVLFARTLGPETKHVEVSGDLGVQVRYVVGGEPE